MYAVSQLIGNLNLDLLYTRLACSHGCMYTRLDRRYSLLLQTYQTRADRGCSELSSRPAAAQLRHWHGRGPCGGTGPGYPHSHSSLSATLDEFLVSAWMSDTVVDMVDSPVYTTSDCNKSQVSGY